MYKYLFCFNRMVFAAFILSLTVNISYADDASDVTGSLMLHKPLMIQIAQDRDASIARVQNGVDVASDAVVAHVENCCCCV